ncbi:MAG: hypothetical protein K2J26_03010 [Ruminococcus sp.]|nr:hypothetical protein [Ruminococcus sp.]
MLAIKDNKVYRTDENSKDTYLAQGFDICDDNGRIIEYSPSATVSRADYDKVLAELHALKSRKNGKEAVS